MPVVDRGDLVWLSFDPQAGYEQAGRRPALVLSPKLYNRRAPFVIVCPITTKSKGYPFEVELPAGAPIKGVILADQVKSIDRRARRLERIGRAPPEVVAEVVAKVLPLIVG
jgi:mRNA interferase MazF